MKKLIIVCSLVIAACGAKNKSSEYIPELTGDLQINLVDSYHLSDSTSALDATLRIHIDQPGAGVFDTSFVFPENSSVGDVFDLLYHGLPDGGYNIVTTVSRPFVILKNKDSIGDARFIDTTFCGVSPNIINRGPKIEVWVYRIDHLIVYFEENIDDLEADTIIRGIGAHVLGRGRSLRNNDLIYRISTSGIGNESEILPILKSAPGVENVYFDLYGFTYL